MSDCGYICMWDIALCNVLPQKTKDVLDIKKVPLLFFVKMSCAILYLQFLNCFLYGATSSCIIA